MRNSKILWLFLAACLIGHTPAFAADRGPEVKLPQGKLVGSSASGVDRFYNIPFAAAPTGPRRWRAPQKAAAWKGVRNASLAGPACPQRIVPAVVAGGVAEYQSEDCLQLNVWRPKGSRKLPVMVWIHGGAHVLGSGAFPAFDGSAFARQGVVLVTINYRLGALGYYAHPALSAAKPKGEALANYGLMDQLAALRWIRANIAAFGGDPNKVTIFGESAGAISVTTILAQKEAKGLFAGAIVQSGVGLLDPRPLAEQEALGVALAVRAGAKADASLADLRALPVSALVNASEVRTPGEMTGPIIDGTLIREAPWRTLSKGEPIDIPLLVGANSNEASVIFAMGVTPAMAIAYLGPDQASGRTAYGSDLAEDELTRQILGDAWFVAPARWLAARSSGGAPSYLYHFDYVATGRRAQAKGAAHGSEIPYLFGTMDYFTSVAGSVSDEDRRFGEAISQCWVGFAKYGEPRCALVPAWPRYSEAGDRLALFAPKSLVVAGFRKAQIDHLLRVHAEANDVVP